MGGSFEHSWRANKSPLSTAFSAKYQKFQDFKAFKSRLSTCIAKNASSNKGAIRARIAIGKDQKRKDACENGPKVRIAVGQAGPKQKNTDMVDSDHPDVSYSRIHQKSQGWGTSKHKSMTADNPEDAVPDRDTRDTMDKLFLP